MSEQKKTTIKKRKRQSRNSYLSKDFFIDCEKDDMLYASLVRSPLASGRITNINFSDLPEGYYFFSARDIPGANEIITMNTTTRVFCNEIVHYMGQPVGIVCGPNLEKTRELAKNVQITFDITTIESALIEASKQYTHPVIKIPDPTAPVAIDGDIADFIDMLNMLPSLDELPVTKKDSTYTYPEQIERAVSNISPMAHRERLLAQRVVKTGFFELTDEESIINDAYGEAKYRVSDSWKLNEHIPVWQEPYGAFCYKEGQKLNILTTTQWSSYLSKNIARVLNYDEEKIVIQKTLSRNDNTSGIWRCTTLAVQTALAALMTEKPVKLILSKEEQNIYMKPGLDTIIYYDSSITNEGIINAMRVKIDCDAGYANPFAQEIADRLAIAAVGLYNIPNLSITVQLHSSDNPPTSIYSELIDSQCFFALENHLHQIAEKTDILPEVIRKKNINLDKKAQVSPFNFKISKPLETINAIIKQSDFNRKYSAFRLNSMQNKKNNGNTFFALPRRGIALTTAYDGACFYGTTFPLIEEKMELILEEEEKLTINAISPSATNTAIWKKIASDILQIDVGNITINSEYAVTEEIFMPESFFNDISIMTVLLKKACEEINKKRKTSTLPIISKKAITPSMKNQWKKEAFKGFPFQSTAFGAMVLEVELNADTYSEKINGIWVAIDCGEILSIKAAENSVRLAIQQEMERLVKDSTVRYENLHISFLESKNPPCQIGKLIHNLLPAAFASALSVAFSKQVNRIPCMEQELYELTLNDEEFEEPEEVIEEETSENSKKEERL